MEVKPPKFAQAIVRWLLPPASVEHVLGDLQERMQGVEPEAAWRQYVLDAIVTVPSVIFSRVLRGFDLRQSCFYAVIQYTVFVGLALLDQYRRALPLTAGSLATFWWITVAVVALKLIRKVDGPLGWLTGFVFYCGLIIYAFVPSEWRFLNELGAGAFIGDMLLELARKRFEKYFTGPRGTRPS